MRGGGGDGIIKKKKKKQPFYDSLQDIVNSLEAQWLGLCTSTAEGMVSFPGRGTNVLRALRHGQKKKRHCPIKHMAEGKTGGKKKRGAY